MRIVTKNVKISLIKSLYLDKLKKQKISFPEVMHTNKQFDRLGAYNRAISEPYTHRNYFFVHLQAQTRTLGRLNIGTRSPLFYLELKKITI